MHLHLLRIHDFRNIASAEVTFSAGLNLIIGPNGQGKTNLLEAIGLLACGRSFRRASPATMRRHGSAGYRVLGEWQAEGLTRKLEFQGQGAGQAVRLDGKPMASVSALGEVLAAVVAGSDALRLVKGEPQERRSYLDWAIFALERSHAAVARDYQRALRARNLVLRQQGQEAELEAWEEQLARLGARIAARRRATLARITPHLGEHLDELGLGSHRFTVTLQTQLDRQQPGWSEEQGRERYRELLAGSRANDRLTGSTSVGPHRDDLSLRMDRHPLAQVASQGQQKRFVLALKLAEEVCVREAQGAPPLVLLDDPATELDPEGSRILMEILANRGNQIFVTSCQPQQGYPPAHRLQVQAGEFAMSGQ